MVHEPHEPHERVLYPDEVFRIQGAIFEVNRELGAGFLEAVYQEALGLKLAARGIPFAASRPLAPEHRAQVLNYLKASGLRLGLLVNFGAMPKARIERLVL